MNSKTPRSRLIAVLFAAVLALPMAGAQNTDRGSALLAVCAIANAQTRSNIALSGTEVRDVAVVPANPAIAYAATDAGIFKTEDRGQSWGKVRDLSAELIAVAATDTKTAYASRSREFSDAGFSEVVKTTDGGATWTQIKPDIASVLAVVPSDPATVYAALIGAGMSKTSDGGATWSRMMSGLPFDFVYITYGWYADSIAVDPTDPSTVYVGKHQGLFKTTDGGSSWKQTAAIPNAASLAIDATNASVIYAASSSSGVLRSDDGGLTWSDVGLNDKQIRALTISRTSPAVLFAGTSDGFLYRSNNGGNDWNVVDDRLPRTSFFRLSVGASGQFLYAATPVGIYQYHFFDDNVSVAQLPDDPQRLPRLFDEGNNAGFVLPVVGSAAGVGGLFSTEVTLTNQRDVDQDVIVTWLPERLTDVVASFRLTLPAASSPSAGMVSIADIGDRLGVTGIGSLTVFAVATSSDDVDPNALIDGSSRIWLYPASGGAPLSQMIPAARSTLLSKHVRAAVANLQQDHDFRTNVGIVNLSADSHQFTIQINGKRAAGQLTIGVPAFALVQVSVLAGDYGEMSAVVFSDTPSRWLFYGSTINNLTQEARTMIGTPADD